MLATFNVAGEQFRVWVTNVATIDELFDLQAGNSSASIPNGIVLAGPGQGDYNLLWSWHIGANRPSASAEGLSIGPAAPQAYRVLVG